MYNALTKFIGILEGKVMVRNSKRWIPLVIGLVFISQCCCCIAIPTGQSIGHGFSLAPITSLSLSVHLQPVFAKQLFFAAVYRLVEAHLLF